MPSDAFPDRAYFAAVHGSFAERLRARLYDEKMSPEEVGLCMARETGADLEAGRQFGRAIRDAYPTIDVEAAIMAAWRTGNDQPPRAR